jgi:hypothetical protein
MMPITPSGSRVTSISTPARADASGSTNGGAQLENLAGARRFG